jgi:hypothetical protein
VTLYERGYRYAQRLIDQGDFIRDERDAWSEHRPTAQQENQFISEHGWDEYSRWHLGIDPAEREQVKARYKFPFGDFEHVHRCGVLSAEVRAAQYKHSDIEVAAGHLHGLIDAAAKRASP